MSHTDEEGGIQNTRSQDLEWLSSLSISELDFLITLKKLAIRRAMSAGCMHLIEEFDARLLRVLGIILIGHLKERVRRVSVLPNSAEVLTLSSGCPLSASNCEKNCGSTTSFEDIKESSHVTPSRKRMREGV